MFLCTRRGKITKTSPALVFSSLISAHLFGTSLSEIAVAEQ